MWLSDEWVGCTMNVDDIMNEVLLSVVCDEDGYFICWVASKPHVHEHSHTALSLCQILDIITFRILNESCNAHALNVPFIVPFAWQLSQYVPADAGSLCDTAAVPE
jgi:hypothetical protein